MPEVIFLRDAADVTEVGGKAFNLGELIRADFSVPNGFVVTTNAVPDEKEILNAFDKLGAKLVAVRSSGVSEDSKDAAWAGQFETFLNATRGEILNKIQKCRESASSARATAYAKQKGLEAGLVAVIVQAMIPSDISGVAFSVHPVTQNHDHVVIEVVRGLGEQLVSGQVTPDHYVVDKRSGHIIAKNLVEYQPILNEGQTSELVQIITKLESYFGFPVDVEWTLKDHDFYILQSRPITTL